jgi:XPG N-terminal domain
MPDRMPVLVLSLDVVNTELRACCRYVKYCMSRVQLLLKNGITPIIVFDGDKLPAKRHTEESRQRCAGEAGRWSSAGGPGGAMAGMRGMLSECGILGPNTLRHC